MRTSKVRRLIAVLPIVLVAGLGTSSAEASLVDPYETATGLFAGQAYEATGSYAFTLQSGGTSNLASETPTPGLTLPSDLSDPLALLGGCGLRVAGSARAASDGAPVTDEHLDVSARMEGNCGTVAEGRVVLSLVDEGVGLASPSPAFHSIRVARDGSAATGEIDASVNWYNGGGDYHGPGSQVVYSVYGSLRDANGAVAFGCLRATIRVFVGDKITFAPC